MGYVSPTLAVRNMKQAIQFYRDCLGFKIWLVFPDADNPEFVDLSKDGMVVMLIPARNIGIGAKEKLGIGVNLYMQIDGDTSASSISICKGCGVNTEKSART